MRLLTFNNHGKVYGGTEKRLLEPNKVTKKKRNDLFSEFTYKHLPVYSNTIKGHVVSPYKDEIEELFSEPEKGIPHGGRSL